MRTANITPDPETGIASWSDDDIKKAITQAVTPDGQKLSPPMPFRFFKNMTDEDLDAAKAAEMRHLQTHALQHIVCGRQAAAIGQAHRRKASRVRLKLEDLRTPAVAAKTLT